MYLRIVRAMLQHTVVHTIELEVDTTHQPPKASEERDLDRWELGSSRIGLLENVAFIYESSTVIHTINRPHKPGGL